MSGIVQGVGFRPFVFRLANSLGLKGRVINTGEEVEIYLEGDQTKIREFIRRLQEEKPEPAEIYETSSETIGKKNFQEFKISESKEQSRTLSMIPPDFGICKDCLAEIDDSTSRRHKYYFNSCAKCGARFSMIKEVPYDRENTAMKDFPLCEDCRREYRNITNIRRGHIQGISCPECGPSLYLTNTNGKVLEKETPIQKVTKLIEKGQIIATKGTGGFHIASLASDDEVVRKLRRRKNRPQKPFALMALDLETLHEVAQLGKKEERLLTSPKRPILLLPERENTPVSKYVAPGLRKLGIMLPYTGTHYLLLKNLEDRFLIMTSGNPRGEPICKTNSCAFSKLADKVDYYLLHNRRIYHRTDDSVLRLTDNEVTMLRRSRGYAPTWFNLPVHLDTPLIAFGEDLKNTGAIGINDKAIPTQYNGDMHNIQTIGFFQNALKFLLQTYEINPSQATLIADYHPQYQSRSLAEEWREKYNTDLELVQHHYAHIISAMIDNQIPTGETVVGIGIDGLGYGIDGNIWGGEVLLADYKGWKRCGHLQYHPMPGGDRATQYPVRMLIGVLSRFMSNEEIRELLREENLLQGLEYGEEELKIALSQCKSPQTLTSSLGRILDSVSALLGICPSRNYEGEAPMKLESTAHNGRLLENINVSIRSEKENIVIETIPLLRSLVKNLDKKKRDLAFTAQFELGKAFGKVAERIVKKYGVEKIIVSGGAAVNSLLLKGVKDAVNSKVILPNRIPPGDGGGSLGQIGALCVKNSKEEEK